MDDERRDIPDVDHACLPKTSGRNDLLVKTDVITHEEIQILHVVSGTDDRKRDTGLLNDLFDRMVRCQRKDWNILEREINNVPD